MAKNGRISQSEIEVIAERVFAEGVTYALVGRDSGDSESVATRRAVSIVREELEKAGTLVQKKRRAAVELQGRIGLSVVRDYLPANYTAQLVEDLAAAPTELNADYILIEGYDRAGRTLDGYVIPRLASGLIVAKEVE